MAQLFAPIDQSKPLPKRAAPKNKMEELKSLLNKLSSSDKHELITVLIANDDKAHLYIPSCMTCAYWNNNEEVCTLYKQRPPLKVIVTACESYNDIDIPF